MLEGLLNLLSIYSVGLSMILQRTLAKNRVAVRDFGPISHNKDFWILLLCIWLVRNDESGFSFPTVSQVYNLVHGHKH